VGNIIMTYNTTNSVNSAIEFNRPDNFVFPGVISGYGGVEQEGSGTLTLTGNNTYTNGITTIEAGSTLQVGNGGTAGTISVDNVTDDSTLIYDRSDNYHAVNLISGTGNVVQNGTGILNLSATNYNTGATVVSNGTLIVSGQSSPNGVSESGDLDLSGGTLISGGAGMISSNSVAGNLNINSGALGVTLNKSLTQSSNTYYVVTGIVNNYSTAGTPAVLAVNNAGPPVKAGDTFAIFNQPVQNIGGAAAVTVTGLGVTWQNNLASNGSIKALTTQTTSLEFSLISVSGTTLTFSAANGIPDAQYVLLGSTNLASGVWTPILTNMFNGSGSVVSLSTNIINTQIPYEFFQLSQP
jgi:fibronectin-binding autotransporter adhesin